MLQEHAVRIDPYSIDELFYLAPDCPVSAEREAQELRAKVRRATKIPTCVGLGPTKTIAKLANRVAKKTPELQGVCDLTGPGRRAAV